ncbi:MAG: hypothetical protein WA667_06790 [Candidatus Nitrosopolaris sp.]
MILDLVDDPILIGEVYEGLKKMQRAGQRRLQSAGVQKKFGTRDRYYDPKVGSHNHEYRKDSR